MEEIIKKLDMYINYEIIDGVNIEFGEILKEIDDISRFDISIENKKYIVFVKLKTYNHFTAVNVLKKIVRFIEYSGVTFYTKKVFANSVEYTLISATEEYKGFMCLIRFS